MSRSECRSKEADDLRLHKKLAILEQDWSSYKQSVSGPRRRRCLSNTDLNSSAATPSIHDLLSRSPKELLLSLQHPDSPSSSDDWKPKTADRDAEQIVAERRAAIRNGRLRGRRLLEALECARDESVLADEEVCSVCSSVMVRYDGGVSSCSCCSTTSIGGGDDRSVRVLSVSMSSSSSTLSSSDGVEERMGAIKISEESSYRGWRWMVRIVWFVLVLVFGLLGVVALREFGVEEYGECMVPT